MLKGLMILTNLKSMVTATVTLNQVCRYPLRQEVASGQQNASLAAAGMPLDWANCRS